MQPKKLVDQIIYRGDDETFSLRFDVSDTEPYDLRAWAEIRCSIRKSDDFKGEIITTLSTKDGTIEIAGEEHNRLIFKLNSSKTALFNEEAEFYSDIKFIDNAGDAQTMLSKNFSVKFNITERE